MTGGVFGENGVKWMTQRWQAIPILFHPETFNTFILRYTDLHQKKKSEERSGLHLSNQGHRLLFVVTLAS